MVYLSYVPSHPIERNNRGAGIRSGHRRESSRRGPSYSRSQQNDANVSVGTKSPPRTRYAPSRGTRPVYSVLVFVIPRKQHVCTCNRKRERKKEIRG